MKTLFKVFCASVLLACISGAAFSQNSIPRIVVDPGGHSGKISKILFTPDGKNIISTSEDKSIRVWDVESGESLARFASEIGDGPEGMIYASALSPDGRILAVAGYPVLSEEQNYIVLIDIKKKEQVGTAIGHLDVINTLDFSGDGKYLASGSEDGTVLIWEIGEGQYPKSVATLAETTPVTRLSFNPQTFQLAVTSESKDIRLYNLTGLNSGTSKFSPKLLKKHKNIVKTVEFSADGRYLASAGIDEQVLLWKSNGEFVSEIHKSGNSVNALTFTHDGNILVAMEDVSGKGEGYQIPSGNKLSNFDKHDNTVFSADFSPGSISGNYLVASAGGNNNEIFIWNAINGRVQKNIKGKGSTIWDLEFGNGMELFISTKLLNSQPKENFQLSFDFSNFNLKRDFQYADYSGLTQVKTDIKQINHYTLQFKKGTFLEVDPAQDGRILDFLETKEGNIIIACDFALKMYDQSANVLKEFVGHSGGVRAISLSEDGVYLASGGEDQTINLWLLSEDGSLPSMREVFDGEEWAAYFEEFPVDSLTYQGSRSAWKGVLDHMKLIDDRNYIEMEEYMNSLPEYQKPMVTLFAADDGEWICWAPSGYFSSSAQGSSYFGWHVNQGVNKLAEFYAADQYFDILYRPEAMPKSINQQKRIVDILRAEGERIFDLSKLSKPSAAFFNTTALAVGKERELDYERGHYNTKSKSLDLQVDFYDGGGGVREIDIYQNGKLIINDTEIEEGVENKRYTKSYTVELLNGTNTFKVVALNYKSVESVPDLLEVRYTGEVVPTSDLYILSVGINDYKNPKYNLNYAAYDARSATETIINNSSKIFKNVKRFEFYDKEATKQNIMQGFELIKSQAKAEDVFVFYYAGHGVLENTDLGEEYFLVPTDVTQMYGDVDQLQAKAISFTSDMKEILASVKPQKQLLLLDACQSGAAAESLIKVRAAGSEEKAIVQLARSAGMVVIAASGTQQYAAEVETLKHGVFTYTLLEGLKGKADKGNDQKITVAELKAYMDERVPELSEEYVGRTQYPTGYSTGQDFPIGFLTK